MQQADNYTPPAVNPLPSKPASEDYIKKAIEYLAGIMDVLTDSNKKLGTVNTNLSNSFGKLGETMKGINVNNVNTTNNVTGGNTNVATMPKTSNPGFNTASQIAAGGL